MNESKLTGKVSWFNEKKGFGVILHEDKEYFAHHSEINVGDDLFRALYENEEVDFLPFEKDKKLVASNITGTNGQLLKCQTKKDKHINKDNKKKRRPKNTENFKPDHSDPHMCVKIGNSNNSTYGEKLNKNDVVLVNDFLNQETNNYYYDKLLNEIKECEKDNEELWKLWHGDTHLIADDHISWKENVPTFQEVVSKIEEYFNFDTKSTRFNWYKNTNDWKPFHHDAAAIKPHIAEKQNTTIAISFGYTRDVAFQFNDNKCVVNFPLKDNSVYVFGNEVNKKWKHGIPQISEDKYSENGRISIILWGWMEQN